MKDLKVIVEELIAYAKCHLSMKDYDDVYIRNLLLNRLNLTEPCSEEVDTSFVKDLKVPDVLTEELKESLTANGFKDVDLLIVEIMGLLTPMPSTVSETVLKLEKEEHGKGLDYLFNLSIMNDYIKKTAIDKNIYFKKEYGDNFIEVTINLSKPEKKNSDIAKLLTNTVKVNYPKCLLCQENLGYKGRSDHPARENIRYVPMVLDNQEWFLQYSPYAYFDHHAIIVSREHHNMKIFEGTFKKLLEFTSNFPTFFVGSNADLPIVGGSILNHEHYQGGLHVLPMFYAKEDKTYFDNGTVKVSHLNWYNTVIRIESEDISKICEQADKIFHTWKEYTDESVGIYAYTGETRHSTITPGARKVGNKYQLNLILRNNRCDEKYPDGIFHAHPEHHNIKQEGIGLIEAMGLFILPARLKRQMSYVEEILTSNDDLNAYYTKYEDLSIHKNMIDQLVGKFGRKLTSDKAHEVVNDFLADTCKDILKNTAVFKDDDQGKQAMDRFMKKVGY